MPQTLSQSSCRKTLCAGLRLDIAACSLRAPAKKDSAAPPPSQLPLPQCPVDPVECGRGQGEITPCEWHGSCQLLVLLGLEGKPVLTEGC